MHLSIYLEIAHPAFPQFPWVPKVTFIKSNMQSTAINLEYFLETNGGNENSSSKMQFLYAETSLGSDHKGVAFRAVILAQHRTSTLDHSHSCACAFHSEL